MVRLYGQLGDSFEHRVRQAYPVRTLKTLNQIRGAHGVKLNDSRFGHRMKSEGRINSSSLGIEQGQVFSNENEKRTAGTILV